MKEDQNERKDLYSYRIYVLKYNIFVVKNLCFQESISYSY